MIYFKSKPRSFICTTVVEVPKICEYFGHLLPFFNDNLK